MVILQTGSMLKVNFVDGHLSSMLMPILGQLGV